MTDGSIQAFTARSNGQVTTTAIRTGFGTLRRRSCNDVVAAYHEAGLQLHIHVNGDEASEVAILRWGRQSRASLDPITATRCSICRWRTKRSFGASAR